MPRRFTETARTFDPVAVCGDARNPTQLSMVTLKIAHVLATPTASALKLARMILPQLEAGTHGAEVAGMMFFDDGIHCPRQGDEVGARLARIAAERNILLMTRDDRAMRRGLA